MNGDDKGDEWGGKTPRAYSPTPASNKTHNYRFRFAAWWATNEAAGYKHNGGVQMDPVFGSRLLSLYYASIPLRVCT